MSLHPRQTLDTDAIREHLSDSLSKYKLPVEITIMDDLPKNAVGKIDKPTLRKRLSKHVETTNAHHISKGASIMGFTKPDLPDVDPDTFMQKPLMERMRILATDWVDNGFGSPRMVHTIYIAKLVLFYALGGILVATLTSGLPAPSCFAVVEPAHRLREGRSVDRAAGADRRRRIVGPAGRQDQADDRWHPVLGPAGHHPATAVEVGAVDRRRPTDLV